MNEQQLVKDAYPEIISDLFKTFVDEWSSARMGKSGADVKTAEQNYANGLELRKAALAKALELTPAPNATLPNRAPQ